MKLLFMGSAAFAVPSLAKLIHSQHHVVEVVTQPDKPAGRGQQLTACPVANYAREAGLTVFQPASVKSSDVIDHIVTLNIELVVVVAYGKILPKTLLSIPPKGCINIHASLLPKYRGAAPIQWAIINGETITGVTSMYLAEEMDAGDMIFAVSTPIDACEMADALHDRLSELGAELLLVTLHAIEQGKVVREAQDPVQATYASILKKEDGRINWQLPASMIYNRFRGLTPWPGTFTMVDGKQLLVWEMATTEQVTTALPGTILKSGQEFSVATGRGQIYLLEVQPEGKKRMSAAAFLRGHPLPVGKVLE